MKPPSFALFGVKEPSKMAIMSFNIRCKMRFISTLIPLLAICFFTWLVFNLPTMAAPQPPIRNDVVEVNFAPVSVETRLVNLQDQLSTRMAQHREIMRSNLDEFNTTLTNITHMADQSFWHLNFHRKLLVVGSGRSELEWIQVAALLVEAESKLRNYTLYNDLRLKLGALTQNAAIMATEMKDMELFMQDTESEVNMLVDGLARALHGEIDGDEAYVFSPQITWTSTPHPIYRTPFFGGPLFHGKPSKPVTAQPLRWSWDVIVDGQVHPTFGEFTQVQKTLIQHFLTYNNVSSPLPTTIPYGIGLPDTLLPQHSSHLASLLFISSEFSTTSTQDGSRYSCDITAYIREQEAKQRCLILLKGCKKHEIRMERQLIGVQSVVCWGQAEGLGARRDIVRERI